MRSGLIFNFYLAGGSQETFQSIIEIVGQLGSQHEVAIVWKLEVLICGYFFNVVGNFFVSWLSSNNTLFLQSSSGDSFIKKGGHIAFLFQEVQFSEIDFCCFVSDSYDEVYEMEASQRRLSTKMSNHSIIMEKKNLKYGKGLAYFNFHNWDQKALLLLCDWLTFTLVWRPFQTRCFRNSFLRKKGSSRKRDRP